MAARTGLGLTTDDGLRDEIEAHLADRPKGAHGEHRYDMAGLGLDETACRARFERYEQRFGAPQVLSP